MPAVPEGARTPARRSLTVAAVLALAITGSALAPGRGAAARDASGPCALAPSAGFGEGPVGRSFVRPSGRRKAVMIMVDFSDLPATGRAADRASFFTRYNDRYLRLASYGTYRLRLRPTAGWVRMPRPWSAYRVRRGLGSRAMRRYVRDAVAAARSQGTRFGGTDMVYIVADDNVPARPTVSQANTFTGLRAGRQRLRGAALVFGRREDSPVWQRGNFVHEANHLYGLPDLYNDRAGASVEYAGGWDTMSMAGISDLTGWHKWRLGWLPGSRVDCVAGPGSSTHTLGPVGSRKDARIAVVRTGPHTALVAEARTRTGLDRGLCGRGVLLYRVDSRTATGRGPLRVVDAARHSGGGRACSHRSPAALAELGDAPFGVGGAHTFADGTRFRVTARDGDRYTVRITVPVRGGRLLPAPGAPGG